MSARALLASGRIWNSGSPASKRIDMWNIMIFQLIVNDMLIQSLSIKAVGGSTTVLKKFTGPHTSRRESCRWVRTL